MKTITATTKAWLTSYAGPDDLTGTQDRAIEALAYHPRDMNSSGWTYAGQATITVELVDNDTLILNKVSALRSELQTVRANAEIEAGNLEAKIQKLLAITNEVRS